MDQSDPLFTIVAAVLAVVAAGEVAAARLVAVRAEGRTKLVASLLFWEGIAMFACAGVVYLRQDFGVATIVSVIAIWLAGAAVGLLRAGAFDAPRE